MLRVKSFRDWSIRAKLTLVAMATTTLALLLASGGFVLYEYAASRHQLIKRVETLAEIIGGNNTAALVFKNETDANTTLATLSGQDNIRAACVYTTEGNILATYRSAGKTSLAFPMKPKPE